MKKNNRVAILFGIFCLMVFISVLSTGVNAENISKYAYIRMENANLYPGDRVALNIQCEIGTSAKKWFKIPYTLEIYKVELDKFKSFNNEKELLKNAVKKEKGRIRFEPSDRYWRTKNVSKIYNGLAPGYYMINFKFGDREAKGMFHISKAALITKSSDKILMATVQDKKTGEPLKDFAITLRSKETGVDSGYTDDNGSLTVDITKLPKEFKGQHIMVLAKQGDDVAMSEAYTRQWQSRFKAYIYTDRPVYRPAQKVYIKAVLRDEKEDELIPAANEKIEIEVQDPKGGKVFKKEVTSSEYGGVTADLTLGDEPPLGNYQVAIKRGNQSKYGVFKVEEYRKPEYEVLVKTLDKFILGGDETKFDVNAKYYFGAPVANTDFTYSIRRQNYYPRFYYYWWEETPSYYRGGSIVKSGKGKTDEKGNAVIKYKTEKLSHDCRYVLTVNVIDESRREVSGSAGVTATRGEFYLTVRADRYFYSPADKVKLNITAKDYNNNPRETEAAVEVYRSVWNRGKRKYDKTTILTKTVKTDKKGKGILEFTPDRVGYFNVKVTAKDKLGNVISGYTSFYSAEDSTSQWIRPSSLSMKGDKKFYEYDDTVKLMVTNPAKEVTALFTLEANGIYEKRFIKMKGPVEIIEFKVKPEYAPNVYATLSFWKGQKFYQTSRRIIVPAKDKFLKVKIDSNKKKYQPREEATFYVTTVKEDGTPVSCEVGMGIVDESIYAVSPDNTPNIQKFFYGKRYDRVSTNSSFLRFYQAAPEAEADAGAPPPSPSSVAKTAKRKAMPKNGGKGDGLVEPDFIREFFPDTCYFNPSIITDNDGRAKVVTKMPDSLTTWRATARAASKKTEVGQNTHEVIVTKDLLVRLITPRFMVERDITTISGIVHNYTDKPLKAHLSLQAEGVSMMTPRGTKKMVEVEPNGKATVEWRVKAEVSGEAKFTVKALTNKVSDAMMLKIPVHPYGIKIVKAKAGSTDDEILLSLILPKDAAEHSSYLKINLSPSLAGTLINALEYLAGYPYGCVEQTMSRFMPNAVVQASLKEFGLKNEKLEKELPKMMKKGFQRLYDYHHSDGGWGWWKNDKSHPFMTAYVVYGLTLAKEAGYKVDESKIKSGAKWLQKNYNDKLAMNTRAYMLFALAEAGVYEKAKLTSMFRKYSQMDSYSRGIIAIALYKAGMKSEAETVIRSLNKSVKDQGRVAYWKGKGARSWTDHPVETTAYIVKAYLLIDPQNPLVEKAVRYLTISRRGNGWYSTKDTAAAVLAIMDYVKMTKEMDANYEADVFLNGKKIKSVSFTKKDIASGGLNLNIPGEKLEKGANKVLVVKKGKGKAYLSTSLTYYRKVDHIKAGSRGIKTTRKYFLVKQVEKKEEAVKTSKKKRRPGYPRPRINEKLIPLDPKEIVLKPQDVVEVVITIESDSDNEYVMIEDMKPAGCEAVKPAPQRYWNWWYAQREFRDEKVAFFVTRLWKGKRELRYRLRAETPGAYRVLPARSELMYIPEIGGNSEEFLLKIK